MGVDYATAAVEHELGDVITNAKPTTRPRRAASKRKAIDLTAKDDDEEDEEETYQPARKKPRKSTSVSKSAKSKTSKVKRLKDDDDDDEAPVKPSKRVKKPSSTSRASANLDDEDEDEAPLKPAKRVKKKSSSTATTLPGEEKRLKRFREKAPQSFQDLYDRATTQRMFVLDRTQTAVDDLPSPQVEAGVDPVVVSPEQAPSATVVLAGTTGNIYSVHITHVPTCTCPAYQKSKQPCKHVIYVLHQVLKAPANLVYQLAFVTTELIEIFQHAPPPPVAAVKTGGVVMDGNRKPVEDDCPICCCELEAESEEIVYCRAACGNNLHKTCFDQWAASKRGNGATVTCPFCRTPWQASDISELAKYVTGTASATGPKVNADGYVNIAQELGISGKRDYSSYHQFWVRRQRRNGLIDDEEEYYDEY